MHCVCVCIYICPTSSGVHCPVLATELHTVPHWLISLLKCAAEKEAVCLVVGDAALTMVGADVPSNLEQVWIPEGRCLQRKGWKGLNTGDSPPGGRLVPPGRNYRGWKFLRTWASLGRQSDQLWRRKPVSLTPCMDSTPDFRPALCISPSRKPSVAGKELAGDYGDDRDRSSTFPPWTKKGLWGNTRSRHF